MTEIKTKEDMERIWNELAPPDYIEGDEAPVVIFNGRDFQKLVRPIFDLALQALAQKGKVAVEREDLRWLISLAQDYADSLGFSRPSSRGDTRLEKLHSLLEKTETGK